MCIQIEKLYKLNSESGVLPWDDCNHINHELVMKCSSDIPIHQISNVVDYLDNILMWETALYVHREELEKLLGKLQQLQP